jgi:TolB-like protein/class 3 adenylate cyclase
LLTNQLFIGDNCIAKFNGISRFGGMSSPEQRRLAAIMFTDMVGYSALAQRDQQLALDLLEEHRRLLREIFPRFNGVEIKTIGDAFLVEFGSALEAAQGAIEIQRTLSKRNLDVAVDRKIQLKIGIHIGDVVHRDGDVYGDGVNIASRIEPLAGAGGVCVSMDVERQIRNALEAKFEKYSSAQLKNIELPMDLFRIVLPWEAAQQNLLAGKPASSNNKKFTGPILVGALLVIALALSGWWFFGRQNRQMASGNGATTAPAILRANSVAVLPFTNMSDDKGAEYFSDGISEELLTVLQKISGLHVAARTSSFSFKDKNMTAQEIGQKLGVANLVEGSVRKSGENVRISARLTRADNGDQLWSENYTRDLKDIFAVQTELAATIVGQLRAQLGGSASDSSISTQVQAAEKGGTKNPAAQEQYLQARFYANRGSEKDMVKGLAAANEAVRLDPGFAKAWGELAWGHLFFSGFSSSIDRAAFEDHITQARAAIARALALEPNLPVALSARSNIESNYEYNWNKAEQTLKEALKAAPQDAYVITGLAFISSAKGQLEQAIALARQAIVLDPLSATAHSGLGFFLQRTDQFAAADVEFTKAAEISPDAPWSQAGPAGSLLFQGKFAEALARTKGEKADYARLVVTAAAQWSLKHVAESNAVLDELLKLADVAAYQVAEVYAYRGEADNAFRWLDRARLQHDPGISFARTDLAVTKLRSDSRWQPFLHSIGLADDQLR